MLLRVSEIPEGHWGPGVSRSWRVGSSRVLHDEALRAYEAGVFAVLRTYRRSNNSELTIELIPYASLDDARSMVPKLWSQRESYPESKLRVVDERIIEGEAIPDVENVFLVEQVTTGVAKTVRVAIARVENVVLSVGFWDSQGDWTWSEIKEVASLQGKKIREVLGANPLRGGRSGVRRAV
ncbi:MAG TPA: hypothetical protein VNE42_01515 [Acidimicrobiales bacterium]|nr:hypothetical protein [Acidimicrobiales bacterium]